MAGRLKDKVALVIGAGSIGPGWGNGKATAVAYGREGATLICVDKNATAAAETAELVRAEGARSLALDADVCDEHEVRRIVSASLEQYGRIDVLHNNVGLALLGGPVDISLQDWSQSLDLNVGYMFLTVRHVLPVMERQKAGSTINISSIASIRWIGTAYIGYAAAKAAVNLFTQAIAQQYASRGIRANAILPGMMAPLLRASRLRVTQPVKKRWWLVDTRQTPPAPWEMPGTSPGPRCFSPPMRRAMSMAFCFPSMAG